MMQESFFTIKDGRYCLPLKANYRRGFGILHARSQSMETCYVEPLTIIPLSNELKEATIGLEQAYAKICTDLTSRFYRSWSMLEGFPITVTFILMSFMPASNYFKNFSAQFYCKGRGNY